MSEAIAEVFVDIRPTPGSFRSEADAEIKSTFHDGVEVPAQLRVVGGEKARSDIQSALKGIDDATVQLQADASGFRADAENAVRAQLGGQPIPIPGQLQLQGLEEAQTQAAGLTDELAKAASVPLDQTVGALPTQLAEANAEANALASNLGRISSRTSIGVSPEGISETEAAVGDLTSTMGDAGNAASGFADAMVIGQRASKSASAAILTGNAALDARIAAAIAAAEAEAVLAAQTAVEARQARAAVVDEESLVRVRARRAKAIGPFRLAGIGLGVGTAVVAGTQALSALSAQLETTGNDALTFGGRMKNLGAALLSFDVVGAMNALTNQTRAYSAAQVIAIDTSQELAQKLEDAGMSLNDIAGLAESRIQALGQLSEVPQFLQTRLAQATAGGDQEGELNTLRQFDEAIKRQIDQVRLIQADTKAKNAALEQLYQLQGQTADQIKNIETAQAEGILAPLKEAVTDARIQGDLQGVLDALADQKAALEAAIKAAKENADLRSAFKDALVQTNAQIEATQDEIIAEEKRHVEAMVDKALAPAVSAAIDAEFRGDVGGQIAALQAEYARLVAIINAGAINGKKLTKAQIDAYKQQATAINGQIESLQGGIASDAARSATKLKASQDKAHQALLNGISADEQRILNMQVRAAQNDRLGDDIKFQKQLVNFYKRMSSNAKLTASERATFNTQYLQAQGDLKRLRQQQRQAEHENMVDEMASREELLQDRLQLAELDERSTKDDERALKKLIAFYRKASRNRDLSAKERRKYLIKLRQAQNDLKDVRSGAGAGTSADFAKLSFEFLNSLQGFSANVASNVFAAGTGGSALSGGRGISTSTLSSPFKAKPATGAAAFNLADAERKTGMTQAQAQAMIHIGRQTLKALQDLHRGAGHPELRKGTARTGAGMDDVQ